MSPGSRGWELDRARKTTMGVMTCLMPVCCVLATQVAHPAIAMTLVATMFFCHAAWGSITGLGGTLGSFMGALSQIYVGKVVDAFGFAPVFIACSGLYPVAFLLVFVMIGKLGVVRKIEP